MSPAAAETTATGSHHDVCLNTPHAATLKPAIAATARTFTTVHRGLVGGGVRPTKDAVIHRNVVPNRKNAAAETFLKVNMGSSSQSPSPRNTILSRGVRRPWSRVPNRVGRETCQV